MARAESKMIMGYLPIEERHYQALLSLVAPAHPGNRLLDPFAGEGCVDAMKAGCICVC